VANISNFSVYLLKLSSRWAIGIESGSYSVEGRPDEVLAFLESWIRLRKRTGRCLFVLENEDRVKELKNKFRDPHLFSFLTYDDLPLNNSTASRGAAVILFSPERVIEGSARKGAVDGGLVRILAKWLWKLLLVTRETDSDLDIQSLSVEDLARSLIRTTPTGDGSIWIRELVLTLLYRRHLTIQELLEGVKRSAWWHLSGSTEQQVEEATGSLLRTGLIRQRKSRFTCNEYGRFVVERDSPLEKFNRTEADAALEIECRFAPGREEINKVPDERAIQLILDCVQKFGWSTVKYLLTDFRQQYPFHHTSDAMVRRLLDGLVARRLLAVSLYNRGFGKPLRIYFGHGNEPSWLNNRCGDCAFYTRNLRRCRFWWAVTRFSGSLIFRLQEELPIIAREKLRYGLQRMGPKATGCNNFLPRKRDYPIRHAVDQCLACGKPVELAISKIVTCGNCGTKYRPLRDKILVLYNHEHAFRDLYQKVVGTSPPPQATLLSHEESETQWKDVLVLYPNEKVTVGRDGLTVKRGRSVNFEGYGQVYNVVDYGALSPQQAQALRKKEIAVVQKHLPIERESNESAFDVKNLEKLRADKRVVLAISNALILSIIIATRRASGLLQPNASKHEVEAQLTEYQRFKWSASPTLDEILGYEARVSLHYWSLYKSLLRVATLGFSSRVRDRFVREVVHNSRARARGYSPANAAINYLHQRRLVLCRSVNVEAGLPSSEGFIHVAERKSGLGLLLDMVDPFKLSDREMFLQSCLRREFGPEDFVSRVGRQRVRFYFPSVETIRRLEEVGRKADEQLAWYAGEELKLMDVYRKYAASVKQLLSSLELANFQPFIYGTKQDMEWMNQATKPIVTV